MSIQNLELKTVLQNLNSIMSKNSSVSEAEFDLFVAKIMQMRAKNVSRKRTPNQETINTFESTDKSENIKEIDNLDNFFAGIKSSSENA